MVVSVCRCDRAGSGAVRAVRRYRAQLALQKADKPATSDAVEALLEQIDASVPPTHAWLRLIEQRPIPPANPTGGTSPAPSTGDAARHVIHG